MKTNSKHSITRKVTATALTAILILAMATACGAEDDTADQKRIGILQFVDHPSIDSIVEGIIDGLADAGFDSDSAIIDLQSAHMDAAVAQTIATKFVADKCDVIVALTTPGAQAAFHATRDTDIPVVFVAVSDPLGAGVIDQKESPSTGVTGLSDLLNVDAQLELVNLLLPDATTVGVVYNAGEANSVMEVSMIEEKAPLYGLSVETVTIASTADVPLAVDAILARDIDVIVNTLDNTLVSAIGVVLDKANDKGVPIIGSTGEQVVDGCLASNGFDQYDLGVESVAMITKVLGGTPTSQIPVENCTNTKIFINKDAAERFGVALIDGANIVE